MKNTISLAAMVVAIACCSCDEAAMRGEGNTEIGSTLEGDTDSGDSSGTDTGEPVAESWPGWCCELVGDSTDYECCSLVPTNGKCGPGEVLVYSRDHPSDDPNDGVCE